MGSISCLLNKLLQFTKVACPATILKTVEFVENVCQETLLRPQWPVSFHVSEDSLGLYCLGTEWFQVQPQLSVALTGVLWAFAAAQRWESSTRKLPLERNIGTPKD